jgi:hypothetical protein
MGREREREREREKERELEREGKRELGNIQRAMLMLCSSAGGTHSDFCMCAVGTPTIFITKLFSHFLKFELNILNKL